MECRGDGVQAGEGGGGKVEVCTLSCVASPYYVMLYASVRTELFINSCDVRSLSGCQVQGI